MKLSYSYYKKSNLHCNFVTNNELLSNPDLKARYT